MQKVKIKIVKIDTTVESQTETLADCGFDVGDIVLAELLEYGGAEIDSEDFERAKWDGSIYLSTEEFEVVSD